MSFLQARLDAKYIHKLLPSNRIILRSSLGATAINNVRNLPLSLQFLAGGTQSVRGYSYQSLGPGKFLFVGSIEFQQTIYREWGAAVYFDFGNALDHLQSNLNDFAKDLKPSVGFGIVRSSPIGPIQIGIAKGLDHRTRPYRLVFSMGPDL